MPIVLAALVLISLLSVIYLMFSGDKAIEAKIAAPSTTEATTTEAPAPVETPEPTTEAPRTTTTPQATTEAPKTTTRPVPTPTPTIKTQPRTTPRTTTPAPSTTQAPPPPLVVTPEPPPPGLADQVISITNQRRAEAGCEPVTKSSSLIGQAQTHSVNQANRQTMFHSGGVVGFGTWGENVAAGQQTAEAVMQAWMNSTTGHRENIENCTYTLIGVGVAYNDGIPYWTQMFAA